MAIDQNLTSQSAQSKWPDLAIGDETKVIGHPVTAVIPFCWHNLFYIIGNYPVCMNPMNEKIS
jgi:hypothetical protein